MNKGDLLFVYGTLRKGECADLSQKAFGGDCRHATFVCEDQINGSIFDLGWFPGLKTEPGLFDAGRPSVYGDVFRLDTDEILGQLDGYEGFPHLYGRFETETAAGLNVWVYVYNGTPNPDRLIPSGNWKDHDLSKVDHSHPVHSPE